MSQQLCIGGEWRNGTAGKTRPVINPATEQRIGEVSAASVEDVDAAVASATRVLADWRSKPMAARGEVIAKSASLLRERIEDIAVRFTLEQGKPRAESVGELRRAAETLEWIANAATVEFDRAYPASGLKRYATPEPIGVIAALTPWNYPAVLIARKVGYALVAGCPVILKAAEEVPSVAVALVEVFLEAGVPRGALSLLFGDPAQISSRLLKNPAIRKLSFTGSTAVGKSLARQAAGQLTQCTLELGGHAPVIVFDDVDIAPTVNDIVSFKFECAGQSCNAPSRLYVHRNIRAEFVDQLTAAVSDIRVGDGLSDDSTMGPLQHHRRLEAVQALVDNALDCGARRISEPVSVPAAGYFMAPTLLADVPDRAPIAVEEPFGPVLPVWTFDSEQEVIALANRSDYGLAAFCFGENVERVRRVAAQLDVGYLVINGLAGIPYDAPTGGVRDSGYGVEGGLEGIADFMHFKLVTEFAATRNGGTEDAN